MAYANKKQYSSSTSETAARPSSGGTATSAGAAPDFDTSTTHYVKNTNKEFVDNVQMWENEGQFGSYIKLRVTEALAPGDYFVSAKKGHVSKVTN